MITEIPINDLKLLERNPRKITKDQLDKLCKSIESDPTFLHQRPVLVHNVNGKLEVYAGNQRVRAAQKLKWKTIPCSIEENLSPEIIKERIIKDNKTYGEFDFDMLANEWDTNLLLESGFTGTEIPNFDIEDLGSTEENNEVLEPAKDEDAITKLGDVYELDGNHMVICGDCCDESNLHHLERFKPQITFTSPPYNLGKSIKLSGNKHKSKDDTPYDKYKDSDPKEWLSLVSSALTISQKFTQYQLFNIQVLAGNKVTFIDFIHAFKEHFVDLIVWKKSNPMPAMCEKLMNSGFKFVIIFSSKENPSRRIECATFQRGTFQNWHESSVNSGNEFNEKHAATMPVSFAKHMVENFCSESVFDPFLGTGTTLIAAEQLKRKCIGIELSPAYCDIIVNRWINWRKKHGLEHNFKRNGIAMQELVHGKTDETT